jgi:parallel beta-helix repeat protein
MAQKIQLRRDTAANWTAANPILAQGEVGFEIDTSKSKVGDGVTAWNSRPYTGVATAGWTQNGAGAVARTVDSKLKDVVSVKDFGAVGDGVADDTAAIQAALNSGALQVYFPDSTYRITNSLVISQALQQAVLASGCTVSLDTATATLRAFDVQAANAVIRGGQITTTLRTLSFLVRLAGQNSKIQDSVLFFATKSTIPPINGVDIPFNRGGVEMRGIGSNVIGCEIYNQEGAGVVSYVDRVSIASNKIHDNVLGIHASRTAGETTESSVYITANKIYDNNVNNAEGACGILTDTQTNAIITENEISTSGEHGAYIYSRRSTISNNRATKNFRVGLKVKSVFNTVVTGNVCQDNHTSTSVPITDGQLEIQVQTEPVNDILFANNICHGPNAVGIKVAYIDQSLTCQRVVFDGNICSSMSISFSNDVTVTNNRVSGDLNVGAALPTAPAIQLRALVQGNSCNELNIGRCSQSIFSNNVVNSFNSGSNISQSNNTIQGNRMTAQVTQISRNSFSVFRDNIVDCSGLATTLLAQGSTQPENNFKQIIGNRFIAHTARVIDDSSQAISGNKNVICNNIFDSATQGVSLWGEGHTIMGNANIGTGGIGFVGCNNSWLIGNSPIITLRAGTSGNVIL